MTKLFLQKIKILTDIHLNTWRYVYIIKLEMKVLCLHKIRSRTFHCFWKISMFAITFDYNL